MRLRTRNRRGAHDIGHELGIAASTMQATLHHPQLGRLNHGDRATATGPVRRYQGDRPGGLVHVDDTTAAGTAPTASDEAPAMAAWGDRWLTGPEGPLLQLHHQACNHDIHAVVVCSECAEPIDVREGKAQRGPG